MDKAIVVDKLVKKFEVTQKQKGISGAFSSLLNPQKKVVDALKGVTFTLKPGELVGFIGPNGAGKTTTLKILSGLLYPTDGYVSVLGYVPWERDHKYLKKISLVLGQKNQLWWDLPAIDSMELNKVIYEIPDKEYKKRIEELTELLEVEDILSTQVRRLSLGQRMRLELMASLLHSPKILFLDEPSIGLDVIAQQKVRDFIKQYGKKTETTILLTSHNMEDIADLCKRVIVVDKGGIVFDGEIGDLKVGFVKNKLIKVTFSKEFDFKKLDEIGVVKQIDFPKVVLTVPHQAAAIAASELLQKFPVADLTIEEEHLETVIRRVFKGEVLKSKK